MLWDTAEKKKDVSANVGVCLKRPVFLLPGADFCSIKRKMICVVSSVLFCVALFEL